MEIQCRNDAVMLDLRGTGTLQIEDLEDLQPLPSQLIRKR